MRALRSVLAVGVTGVLAWGLAVSSGVALRWHADDASELRLSWSARPQRIETCRTLSAEELAARPAHMQRAVECVGVAATYALLVMVDGDTLSQSVVQGGGLRHDRSIFLLRSFPMPPGERRVVVRFTRRELIEPDTARNRIPPVLTLDTLVQFRPGAVALVAYESGNLFLRER